jgi:hypothetical protein
MNESSCCIFLDAEPYPVERSVYIRIRKCHTHTVTPRGNAIRIRTPCVGRRPSYSRYPIGDLVAWVKICFQLSTFAGLGTNSVPVNTTSVLISLTRQQQHQPRTRRSTPRQHRPRTPESGLAIVYSPFNSDFSMFSMQEHS